MDNQQLFKVRHSLAHVLLQAINHHFPHAKPTIGPVIDTGFYYDIDFTGGPKIKEEDFEKIESTMREIITRNLTLTKEEVAPSVALGLFSENKYKVELITNIANADQTITLYRTGDSFFDLCEGPHVKSTSEIPLNSFKLDKLAGAYWRGDEKREMLTRIYGLAFENKEALDTYQMQLEEAKKRDHRILGKELKLFTFSDLVGPGLPLWTPRGTVLRKKVDEFVQEIRSEYNYQGVAIPHVTKSDLYKKSGHWDKYAEDLYKIETRDGHTLCMKPMNCPHHAQIYASELRSYKELPIRFSETTMVYRDEQSGELNGLSRVLSITQDDAHIFCRESQLEEEINNVWNLIEKFYTTFHFGTIVPRFSKRNDNAKFKGNSELWEKAEGIIHTLLEKRAPGAWVSGEGEAAFYGPKIDFIATDNLGRKLQVGTIQLDYVQPTNFGLEYVSEEGRREMPVMIHCAIAGSLERFLSVYIEHTAGNFPLWIAPVQVSIIPIADKHSEYAKEVANDLRKIGIRVELLDEKDGLGKKIRKVKEMKNPYWIVIGDKDIDAGKVTLESRDKGQLGQMDVSTIKEHFTKEVREKI